MKYVILCRNLWADEVSYCLLLQEIDCFGIGESLDKKDDENFGIYLFIEFGSNLTKKFRIVAKEYKDVVSTDIPDTKIVENSAHSKIIDEFTAEDDDAALQHFKDFIDPKIPKSVLSEKDIALLEK